jgi:regulatory protein
MGRCHRSQSADQVRDQGPAEHRNALLPDDPDCAAAAERVALRILAGAAQSAAALHRGLRRRGFTEEAAGAATAAMLGRGYVDDAALALSIAARSRRTGHGRIQMTAQLRARGVDDEAIAETLGAVDPEAERAAALTLGRRLWGRASGGSTERQRRERMGGALQRRGFDTETVHWVLRELERNA